MTIRTHGDAIDRAIPMPTIIMDYALTWMEEAEDLWWSEVAQTLSAAGLTQIEIERAYERALHE